MHGDVSAAYAVWHDAQRGSGTSQRAPGPSVRLLSVGCSQPSGDGLDGVWGCKGCHTWRKIK